MPVDQTKEDHAAKLRGSFLEFTRFFYEHVKGRKFIVSQPICRESHHITIARALTSIYRLQILREIINVPPGSGKSTFLCMWVAWCWSKYPDSNFLYISYSRELASKHTEFIKTIVMSRMYQYLFDVHIDPLSRAKVSFKTTKGGSIMAFGSAGAITGQDGGLPDLDRFTGAVIIDDAHKPDEVHSDKIREGVIKNYDETIRQRCRGVNVPIIYIGQRLHEDDLTNHLLSGKDVDSWHTTIIKGLDVAGNALYPEAMPTEKLLAMQEKSPYVFASQYQQDPMPAGGALFKRDWFVLLEEDPTCLVTFITADTAETDKSWNDATVFSFWGLYEIETMGRKTGEYGLHWIDCLEARVEPKDLESLFMDFYGDCVRYPVPPLLAFIEKKSTGVTLVSVLEKLRGMQIRPVERNADSGNKTQRFIQMQPHIASKHVSLTAGKLHVETCLTHMLKITANNTHRHDDIADTVADAVYKALIEKVVYVSPNVDKERGQIIDGLNQALQRKLNATKLAYGRDR
jgi:predicted phage terminase large subunit-like protein